MSVARQMSLPQRPELKVSDESVQNMWSTVEKFDVQSLRPCQVHEADRFLPKGEMSTDLEIFGGLMVRPLRCSTLMLELMPFERHLPGFGSAV
eukprot:g10138.t1